MSAGGSREVGEVSMECIDCTKFKQVNDEAGKCRAHPPVIVESLFVDDMNEDMTSVIDFMTRWPIVGIDDWCAEFQQK
jgi:hypothetical protein